MYCTHFNLNKKPFQLSSDNNFLWLGETHARALDLLKRGIEGSEQLLVLTGDIGTGKTTLIHELRHYLPQTTAVAHISDPNIELNYLFLSIAQGLGFDDLYRDGEKFAPVLWAFLNRLRQTRKKCLIIIDEAHLIPGEFLAELPSWAEFAPDSTLTIILAGQLELHQVMEQTLGRSWESQVDVHAVLSPLEEKQTREYIDRRLELAGATRKIFIPGAVREVHGYTKGIPRRINIACDQAMIAAYASEMQTVDARIFQKAVGILELPQVPVSGSGSATASQRSSTATKLRRWVKVVPVLAAAVFLTIMACAFYFRNPSAPDKTANLPIKTPTAQTGPAVVQAMVVPSPATTAAADRQEAFQATPQIAPPALSEQITVESGSPADKDAFIKEVLMMHKADLTAQVPDSSPRGSTFDAPAPDKLVPVSAVPWASRRQHPGSVHDSVRSSFAQPDPDAVIDWLIKEKSR